MDHPVSMSTSSIQLTSFSHRWTIEHFEHCQLRHDRHINSLQSGRFSPPANPQLRFHMVLYPRENAPRGRGHNNEERHLSLYLHFDSAEVYHVTVDFQFGIIDAHGNKRFTKECHRTLLKERSWGYPKLVPYSHVLNTENEILRDGALTIFCEIHITDTVSIEPRTITEYNPNQQVEQVFELQTDLHTLWHTKEFADLVLVVSDKEDDNSRNNGVMQFHVHKTILTARSAVFAEMFRHQMSETLQNRVDIVNTNVEAFEQLLRFIYTGKVDNVDQLARELLPLADKFQMDSLKSMCEESLIISIPSTDSLIDLLTFARRYNAHKLVMKVLQFIQRTTVATVSKINLETNSALIVSIHQLIRDLTNLKLESSNESDHSE